jgi:ATP-dependent RNA helicase DeaD
VSDSELHPTLTPTAARGHNIVLVVPPSPAYAAPIFAGLAERPDLRALLLCPAAERDEWGAAASAAAGERLSVQVAHGTARAQRRLRAGAGGLLVTDADTALALLRRSALATDALGAVVLAWPERYQDEEGLAALMQDLPKDTQRIVVTADAAGATRLVERYARKALTLGPTAETPAEEPIGPVRAVTVPWNRRAAAVAEVLELLDPARAVVWAADPSAEAAVRRAVPLGDAVAFTTDDTPKTDLVIAYDLPSHARLAQLRTSGDVVLLVPPGTEGYVERIAAPRRPLRLPGLIESVTTGAAAQRAAIQRQLESGGAERAVLALAPLFERHDPAAVAAALYELWRGVGGAPAAGEGAAPDVSASARVWVNVGRNDEATANDLVAVLTKEVRVDRGKIGRIELRDAFSLIELPAQEAERIAAALTGLSVRRKRLSARLDRGPTRGAEGEPERGAPRGPSRGPGARGPRPGPPGRRPGGSRPPRA